MANKMYERSLVTHVGSGVDSSQHVVVAHQNLADFQNETVTNINSLMDHVNHLHRKLNDVSESLEFASWIQTVHPHLIEEYKISERVAARLTDDDCQDEVMCEKQA